MFAQPKYNNDRYFTELTASGVFVFDCYGSPLKVQAVRDEDDGDWKTSLVHGYRGIKAGEQAVLHEIWSNCYGRWARIEYDGRKFDVRLSALKMLECHSINKYEKSIAVPYE